VEERRIGTLKERTALCPKQLDAIGMIGGTSLSTSPTSTGGQ